MSHDHHPRGSSVLAGFVAGAATALIVGGYLLYGPEGRRRRDELEEWLEDAEETIAARVGELKDMSREAYDTVVDEVLEDYAIAKGLATSEAKRLSARLKARYRGIREAARDATRDARRETKDLEAEA